MVDKFPLPQALEDYMNAQECAGSCPEPHMRPWEEYCPWCRAEAAFRRLMDYVDRLERAVLCFRREDT